MEKEQILKLLNSKDIRCIGNSEEVIFVTNYTDYIGKDNKNYCDGINVLINSEKVEDDISQLYCVLDCGCIFNLSDYYAKNGFYDNIEQFYNTAKEHINPKIKELDYYWYHHGMPIKDREAIQKAISNHDFETFISFYKKYNSKGIKNGYIETEEFNAFFPIIYLPDTASYFIDNKHYLVNILSKDNFNRITYSEYECG